MSVPDRLPPKMRQLLAEARMAERADVLAHVARKAVNAGKLAANNAVSAESRELANDRRRQAEVLGDELIAGMHEGLAGVAADVPEAFGETGA